MLDFVEHTVHSTISDVLWTDGTTPKRHRLWQHWLTVIIPDDVKINDAAMLRISDGTIKDR